MGESSYTKSVSNLVRDVESSTTLQDSIFEQAKLYFESSDKADGNNLYFEQQKQIRSLEESLQSADAKNRATIAKKLSVALRTLKKDYASEEDKRIQRLHKVLAVVSQLLVLSEAENWQKTQVNSAKLLGTLQLLSPGEGPNRPILNQRLKPIYRGVLAIRLLDKLLNDGQISTQYIKDRYQADRRYPENVGNLTLFQREVAIPVLMSALFQDIGTLHPKAQLILKGKDGKLDQFRLLDKEDRMSLLKINHEQSLNFITFGLGVDRYVGNSKEERNEFEKTERQRLNFIRTLLVSALKPKLGLGNLIKAPQIYTSIIFSSKQSNNFFDLPKAMLIVAKAAEREAISKIVADSLLSIVGHFPQGYGITYIPKDKDNDNKAADRYEYAIVTGLNPEDPFVPKCRVATRNLTFIASGQVISIDKNSNLYFATTKKRLEKINPARLQEILRKLASNFEERKELEILPSYWNPHSFFGYKKLQNLWKKV
ncbi:MAG: hypothetical protein ACSHWP_00495 [Pseudoalteromonas sp.]